MSDPDFAGVNTPLVTPFRDGDVDFEAYHELVDHVVDGGVSGLVPAGTTGEFASLSDDEYYDLLAATVEAADGRVPVMAGAAATSIETATDRIRTAAAADVDAVLVTLPFFHTANDPAGNEAFLEAVADEAALPVYLYNIPSCTGQEISPDTVESLSAHPNVHGLKDSGGDFTYFTELARRTGADFELFQGFDSLLVPGMVFGATGGINALSNVIPEAFAEAYECVQSGDVERAREIQREVISPLFEACLDHGFATGTKAGLVARGVVDSDDVRPPLVSLDPDAHAEIEATVARSRRAFE